MYKTNYTNPMLAITGREIWNANAPEYQRFWYTLVLEAAKQTKIAKQADWLKSFEEINSLKMKRNFAYESKAVFSDPEVRAMSEYIREARQKLETFRARVKKRSLSDEEWLDFDNLYKEASKEVSVYDATVDAIANQRAAILYRRPVKKGQKVQSQRGMTYYVRVDALPLHEQLLVTNPTGLLGDTRHLFRANAEDAEHEILDQFEEWANRLDHSAGLSPLSYKWVRWYLSEASVDGKERNIPQGGPVASE